MKMARIEDMFQNREAIRRKDIERECGCYPNQIHRLNGWFVLVVLKSSQGPDYPIGERGIKRARKSLDNGYVDNAYVVLADRNETGKPIYQSHQTLGNVERILKGIDPYNFREDFGPCWFTTDEFTVIEMNFGGRDTYRM